MSNLKKLIGPVMAWHLAVLACVLFVPGYVGFSAPVWSLPGLNSLLITGLALAYLAGAVIHVFRVRLTGFQSEVLVLGATAAVVGLVLFLVLLTGKPEYSRPTLISAAVLMATGLIASLAISHVSQPSIVAIAAVGCVVILLGVGGSFLGSLLVQDGAESDVMTETISASRHTLIAQHYSGYVPPVRGPGASGGAITPVPENNGYFLVTADGRLFLFEFGSDSNLIVDDLGIRVPLNRDDFVQDIGQDVDTRGFRVADIATRFLDGRITVFVSHHVWDRQEKCFFVRISKLTLESIQPVSESDRPEWSTLFESSPCLPIVRARGTPFAGVQIGGNLEFLDDDHLLVTMGDHQFDGWYRDPNLVQDMSADYGKTLRIEIRTGDAEIMTVGHRNAQGLVVDTSGRIWSTEHGPRGGDELNLLQQDRNYGYPYHTYGTEYGSVIWPVDDEPLKSIDHELPVYSWVPSIGISDLIEVNDPSLERWNGNLLISSLRSESLWRVELTGDNHVAYVEPIEIGTRIRDLASRQDGALVLWTDQESIVRLTPATGADSGAAIFAVQCGGCHDDNRHRIGPHLKQLFTRGIGEARGYEFSEALSRIEGQWTEEKLHEFLAAPSKFAPGTRMAAEGIDTRATRDNIIEYLRRLD